MTIAVVKLGGSTASQPDAARWIAALPASRIPHVIVPGGGPFADHIRAQQSVLGFSDRAAHAMAILAMEQFGHLLLDRDARLTPARTLAEIDAALTGNKVPVWMPSLLALSADDIPASWDITSDSLAAWLSGRLGASSLLLIKQTDAFETHDTLDTLIARGILDPLLASMLPPEVHLHIAGPRHLGEAAGQLAMGSLPGVPVQPKNMLRRVG